MGTSLKWNRAQRQREVEHYLKRVEAERESQMMPDDETADAARMGAPDVVPISVAPAEGASTSGKGEKPEKPAKPPRRGKAPAPEVPSEPAPTSTEGSA